MMSNQIDDFIAEVIIWCNTHKFRTKYSCSGHSTKPYNTFDESDLLRFPKIWGDNWRDFFYYNGYISFKKNGCAILLYKILKGMAIPDTQFGLDNGVIRISYTKLMNDLEIKQSWDTIYNQLIKTKESVYDLDQDTTKEPVTKI